jgi:hypothetical protein
MVATLAPRALRLVDFDVAGHQQAVISAKPQIIRKSGVIVGMRQWAPAARSE